MLGCSIIVPTYNRCSQLRACLASLLVLDYPTYEIIVVDDGSIDGTAGYLTTLAMNHVRTVHLAANRGASEARNQGIAQARFPLLAFTDDDCIADHQWLRELLPAFDDERTSIAIGETIYVATGYRGYFPERIVQNPQAKWPMTSNIAYRRTVFETVGDFSDEFFHRYRGEDFELAIRAVTTGFRYVRRPRARVFHQQATWTPQSLLSSAKFNAVLPVMKKRYPNTYRTFQPPVVWGLVAAPRELLYLMFAPILIPLLLLRYLVHGKRNLVIFFTKWPLWLILKRYYLWRESLRQGVVML